MGELLVIVIRYVQRTAVHGASDNHVLVRLLVAVVVANCPGTAHPTPNPHPHPYCVHHVVQVHYIPFHCSFVLK